MRATTPLLSFATAAAAALALAGCHNPPPPRIQIPSDASGSDWGVYQHDEVKPLPTQPAERELAVGEPSAPPPGTGAAAPGDTGTDAFANPPSRPAPPPPPPVSQAYLDAYDRVGRPRLMVVIDRPETAPRSLVPGDYDALERVVREALAANGQVAVVPAASLRQSLSMQQIHDAATGNATALGQAGQALRADVIVSVTVDPPANDQTKITATARNARDGQTIATVTSQLPSPPPRRQLDFAGRLLGERMVDELATTWDRLAGSPATQPGSGGTAPTTGAAGANTSAPPPLPAPAEAPPSPPTPPVAPPPPPAPAAPTPPPPPAAVAPPPSSPSSSSPTQPATRP